MVVVDSSVWIAALRSRKSRQAEVLTELLDADEVTLPVPVRVELLAGVKAKDQHALRTGLSALPVLYPSDDTWRLVERWVERASVAHERFGMGDLLIGALAAEAGALVWSLDNDFARLSRLKLVQLYDPD